MTKVMKGITHELMGERKPIKQPFTVSLEFEEMPSNHSYKLATKVGFLLKWESYAFVSDSSEIPEAKKNMVEGLRRSLYSDVEDRVISVMESLYRMDDREAMTKCHELMQYMKEV